MQTSLISCLLISIIGLGCTIEKHYHDDDDDDWGEEGDYEIKGSAPSEEAELPSDLDEPDPLDTGHGHDHGEDDPDGFDPSTEQTSSTGVTVSYTTDPTPIPESEEFSVTFTLSEGRLSEADATMPTHGGHGMNVFPLVIDNGDGTFTASPFEFHMPGYWVIHAMIVDEDGTEERIDFDVECCEAPVPTT